MKARHKTMLDGIQQAIISGDAALALSRIEALARRFDRDRPDPETRADMERTLLHLRRLAEDSARGTQRAIDQIKDILRNARMLQTYDHRGQRRQTPTDAVLPQRF
ncbi:hypothetical protein GIY56_08385 [Paracoccus sp. YIM 132242]|uniref:Flagellar protein FlgN n=1 Tax=Paracoccus lichenicola TaxID=2665644 RepID=A0A6L6HPJ0_9RHOB|nr:hypothetical protein [Paracoccus lichenicola]MTE00302.1 hypothetical protein [Paracoccus lichenicola]